MCRSCRRGWAVREDSLECVAGSRSGRVCGSRVVCRYFLFKFVKECAWFESEKCIVSEGGKGRKTKGERGRGL